MSNNLKYFIGVAVISFILGFFIRGLTTQPKEVVKYIKGETIHGSIPINLLTAKFEYDTKIEQLPLIFWYTDTVVIDNIKHVNITPDTAKIVKDFLVKREYDFNVFDNQDGKLNVQQVIQYNKLQKFDYTFTPIHKEVVKSVERRVLPFISTSYNTLNYTGIGGGVFIDNIGVEYEYNTNFQNNHFHKIGVKYKF